MLAARDVLRTILNAQRLHCMQIDLGTCHIREIAMLKYRSSLCLVPVEELGKKKSRYLYALSSVIPVL